MMIMIMIFLAYAAEEFDNSGTVEKPAILSRIHRLAYKVELYYI